MNKIILKKFFSAIFFAVLFFVSTVQAAEVEPKEPEISATSAILIEASTGRVIYEKNSTEKRPPASMTKMLTCVLGLENLSAKEKIFISPVAAKTEDSYLGLTAGDVISAEELLKGVMMVSDNGGAVAIGQAVSGNIPMFADLMNEKAKELGCKNSNFANPNGLPNENHYSTAEDMAKIAAYCMKNKNFRELVATKKSVVRWIAPAGKKNEITNTNELLENYEGINGIKTGWTRAAGGCLAASAKRKNIELIAVVMNSADNNTRFSDAEKLLNYGFEKIKKVREFKKEKVYKKIFVKDGKKATLMTVALEDLNFPLFKDERAEFLTVSYEVPKIVGAEIKRGEIIGEAILKYEGKKIASVPMVADEQISKGFSFGSFLVGLMTPFLSLAENNYLVLSA